MAKKQTKEERLIKLSDVVLESVDAFFKKHRVSTQPKQVVIDRGGVYLNEKDDECGGKTYVIVSWITKKEFKEVVFSFNDYDDALFTAKNICVKYENCRLYQALKI